MNKKQAFTLIELLIVVAIIAILAAIAVPNFLEAQVRAKVSRAKNDMRAIATALESYRVDNSKYPVWSWEWEYLARLTKPIAYITSIPKDPFAERRPEAEVDYTWHHDAYLYGQWDVIAILPWGVYNNRTYNEAFRRGLQWFLASRGPNRIHDAAQNPMWVLGESEYDPTNGTISRGDIERFGP